MGGREGQPVGDDLGGHEGDPGKDDRGEDDPGLDWVLKAAHQVQELVQTSVGIPPWGLIQAAIRVQYWAWSTYGELAEYPANHWTSQAAQVIRGKLLNPDEPPPDTYAIIRDHYLATMPGAEIEDDEDYSAALGEYPGDLDNPEIDPDWDPNDWSVRAASELDHLVNRTDVVLSADDIRQIILDEFNDEGDADFDIVEPIEHMDLESAAGTTVNIHAPVDTASFIMGPGATINVFEPIAEVAIEQENGGTVWFLASPDTSHIQQGPGSLINHGKLGCTGCGGSDTYEGCSGMARDESC